MALYHLRIITPDSIKYDGEAERIIVRTTSGDTCILAGHIDYAAPLGIGEAKVIDAEGKERYAACNSGFISVTNGNVTVASTTFEWAQEIDRERAEASKAKAEQALSNLAKKDANYCLEDARLRRALARLSASVK